MGEFVLKTSDITKYAISNKSGSLNNGYINGSKVVTMETMKEIIKRLSQKPIVKHQCHGCGATLEIDPDKHIFICRYCDSVYALGTALINDRGV